MRLVHLLITAVVITGCSAPERAETSSSSGVASASSSPAPTTLLPEWEPRLKSADTRERCSIEGAFALEPTCGAAIQQLGVAATELGTAAGALGTEYAPVRTESTRVSGATSRWLEGCVRTQPGTSDRLSCLETYNAVDGGAEAMLFALYKIEKP